MALSFKERNAIRKQIGEKLADLDKTDLSFKERNVIRKQVGELLAQLDEQLDQKPEVQNQKLADLIAGKFNDETPVKFLAILKEIVDEIKDLEPVKAPAIAYIEAKQAA